MTPLLYVAGRCPPRLVSGELTSYAKDFYTLLAVAGLLAIAYLAVSIWRPEWLV